MSDNGKTTPVDLAVYADFVKRQKEDFQNVRGVKPVDYEEFIDYQYTVLDDRIKRIVSHLLPHTNLQTVDPY